MAITVMIYSMISSSSLSLLLSLSVSVSFMHPSAPRHSSITLEWIGKENSRATTDVVEDGFPAVMMLLRLLINLIEFRRNSSVNCQDSMGPMDCCRLSAFWLPVNNLQGDQLRNSFVYLCFDYRA